MKRVVEAITMAVPELRDDVYLFPQKRDVPAVIGKNDVGWRYVDLRHLDAPAKLRHAAILADGRVLLPALLCFKTELLSCWEQLLPTDNLQKVTQQADSLQPDS
jgi:hypothetical protein